MACKAQHNQRAGDKFGSRDVLLPSMTRSETLSCYNNNAEKPGKVGQQKELRTAGVLKRAVEMEGHDSSCFVGKNQPPPGEEKYCKSLMKAKTEGGKPPTAPCAWKPLSAFYIPLTSLKTEVLQGIVGTRSTADLVQQCGSNGRGRERKSGAVGLSGSRSMSSKEQMGPVLT